jgi:hypothetical protein
MVTIDERRGLRAPGAGASGAEVGYRVAPRARGRAAVSEHFGPGGGKIQPGGRWPPTELSGTMISVCSSRGNAWADRPFGPRWRLASVRLWISLTLAGGLLVGCAGAPKPPRQPDDACAIFAEKPKWHKATRRAERRWGTPMQVQLAIIRNESSFRHDARPRTSSAYGYSQAIDGTWNWYREQTGRSNAKRTDFADAADFVGWYTDLSQRLLGISKWDGYNQYLAYHEGHTGFQRGSYRRKDWLVAVARRVDEDARTYGEQLRRCRMR